jgi:hypothetical protein
MLPKHGSLALHYGVAAVASAPATGPRFLPDPLLGHPFPFVTVLPAILLTARAGGFGPELEAALPTRDEAWARAVVLITVTGWGREEDRRRSKEAGFDQHTVKPADPQALMRLPAGLSDAAKK